MRMVFILAVVALVTMGCNNNDTTEVTSTLPESKTASEQEASAAQMVKEATESKPSASTRESTIDPFFEDYQYPGSKLDGTFSTGGVVSAAYRSADNSSTVVEFYKQKFPRSMLMTGTSANFAKQNPDGSSLTVTVTPINDSTQIILKHAKKG